MISLGGCKDDLPSRSSRPALQSLFGCIADGARVGPLRFGIAPDIEQHAAQLEDVMKELVLLASLAFQIPGGCVPTVPQGYERGVLDIDATLALAFELMMARRFEESRCLAQAVADRRGEISFDHGVEADYRLLELAFVLDDLALAEVSGKRLLAELEGRKEYSERRSRLVQRLCVEEDWSAARQVFLETC